MSHNSRSFIPGDAIREEPRTMYNTWRKVYGSDAPPPPPPQGVPHSVFASSTAPPPPSRDWWGPPPPGPWKPPLAEDDGRRFNFSAPPSGRGNVPPTAPRGYNPPYPDTRASPDFLERSTWGVSRGEGWSERPVTPFNERSLGIDHWSPSTASSSARERDRDWDLDPRGIRRWSAPRRTASPPYAGRPLLEPSQAWKNRERQMSTEHSTAVTPGGSSVVDLQSRRFHPLPAPPPPPPPGRMHYNDRFPTPTFPRRLAPPRRQQRISARISARPNREPSPSSSESSARSRSRSIRSPPSGAARERRITEPAEDLGPRSPQKGPSPSVAPVPPSSSSKFTFRSAYSPSQEAQSPIRRPSASPSWSGQSSIRSSVHSSPRLVTTELEPPKSRRVSPVPADAKCTSSFKEDIFPSLEDTEFELPGMRFLKDGALKPGLEPPALVEQMPPDGGSETLAKKETTPPETARAATVEGDSIIPRTDAPELPRHPPLQDVNLRPEAPPRSLSPHLVSPPPANLTSAPTQAPQPATLSTNNEGLQPVVQRHDTSPIVGKRAITLETQSHEIPQTEPSSAIDKMHVAPVSSPLSDLIPLSPSPDIPELQEDLDDSSSMSIDDDSSSTSSDSGPADDFAAALRVFVKSRDAKDSQTRSERYAPILRANHALVDPLPNRIGTSGEALVRETLARSLAARFEGHAAISHSLLDRFAKKAEELETHTRRLREEYKSYHDKWVADCRKLDQSMASSASQGVEGLPVPSGRVTRRSAALGDTVRSDLEMEQIIASLGNEDMTDPNVLAIRNTATIPDLISTDPFAVNLSFDDDNGLVDDPAEFFDVYDTLGRWTDEERQVFAQKYGVYPKQFGAIASFLPNKTPAQCVMFYYLHKKELVDFRAAISTYGPKRKRRGKAGKGKGNALLADIVKPTRAGADDEGVSHKHSDRFIKFSGVENGRLPNRRPPAEQDSPGGESHTLPTIVARGSRLSALQQGDDPGSNADTARQITHVDTEDSPQDEGTIVVPPVVGRRKIQARISIRRPPRPREQVPEEEFIGEAAKKPKQAEKGKEKEKRPPGRPPKKSKERAKALEKAGGSVGPKSATSYVWSKGEEATYLKLVARHGKDFEKIAGEMPAKTALQCRNYFRSHANDLDLERIVQESSGSMALTGLIPPPNPSAPTSKDKKNHNALNGGSDPGSSKSLRRTASFRSKDGLAAFGTSPSDGLTKSSPSPPKNKEIT